MGSQVGMKNEDVVMLLSSVWANRNCGHFIAWWLTGILWFTDCWVLAEFLWTQCLQSTPETRTSGHSEPGATQRFTHLINSSYDKAPSLEITLKSFSGLSGRYCEGRKKEQLEITTLRVLCCACPVRVRTWTAILKLQMTSLNCSILADYLLPTTTTTTTTITTTTTHMWFICS